MELQCLLIAQGKLPIKHQTLQELVAVTHLILILRSSWKQEQLAINFMVSYITLLIDQVSEANKDCIKNLGDLVLYVYRAITFELLI